MNTPNMVMAVLCVTAVTFLLRVLWALVRERSNTSSHAVEVYSVEETRRTDSHGYRD